MKRSIHPLSRARKPTVATSSHQTEMEALPLFSPSQVPSEEKIIGSIFSPNFAGGVTAGHSAPVTPASSREGWQNRIQASESAQSLETPKNAQKQTFPVQKPVAGNHESKDEFFSPYSDHNQRTGVTNDICRTTLSTPGENTNDQFFSPDEAPSRDFSAVSPLSYATCESFKTLPIDSLSFEFVKNCQSAEELEQIVSVLTAGSPKHYPSLVRTAQKQLKAINNAPAAERHRKARTHEYESYRASEPLALQEKFHDVRLESTGVVNQNSLNYSPSPQNQSREQFSRHLARTRSFPLPEVRRLATSTEIDNEVDNDVSVGGADQESTLVMSLSSSSIFEDIDDCVADEKEKGSLSPPCETKTESTPLLNPSLVHRQSRASARAPPDANSAQVHDAVRAKLSEQIRKLTDKVKKLESDRKADHTSFFARTRMLEKLKKEAEQVAVTLEKKVASSAAEREKFEKSLAEARHETRSLQKVFELERKTAEKKAAEAQALEKELRRKVKILTDQLVQSQEQMRRSCQSVERNLREQLQKEASIEQEALNRSLREARDNLEEVRKERNLVIHSIQKAMGGKMSLSKIGSLSKQEREEVVYKLSKKGASMRAASKALAKSHAASEQERRLVIDERDHAVRQFQESKSSKSRLERENMSLTKQIQDLADELASSRNYIDRLLGSKKEDNPTERDRREEAYKHRIRRLESQLLQREPSVPVDLYSNALDEARTRAKACKESCRHTGFGDLNAQGVLEKKLKSTEQKAPVIYRKETQLMRRNTGGVCNNESVSLNRKFGDGIKEKEVPVLGGTEQRIPGVHQHHLPGSSRHSKSEAPRSKASAYVGTHWRGVVTREKTIARVPKVDSVEGKDATHCVENMPVSSCARPRPSAPVASKHAKFEALRSKHLRRKLSHSESREKLGHGSSSAGNVKTVTPTPSCEKENTAAKAIKKSPPGNGSKKFSQHAVVRAAGGRAGLSAKLKQLRPSPRGTGGTENALRPKNCR